MGIPSRIAIGAAGALIPAAVASAVMNHDHSADIPLGAMIAATGGATGLAVGLLGKTHLSPVKAALVGTAIAAAAPAALFTWGATSHDTNGDWHELAAMVFGAGGTMAVGAAGLTLVGAALLHR